MLRCKEGDLAVILRGAYTGYFVTVGSFLGRREVTRMSDGLVHTIDNCWEVFNDELCRLASSTTLTLQDDNLQPIRPGRTPTTTETEKEITA